MVGVVGGDWGRLGVVGGGWLVTMHLLPEQVVQQVSVDGEHYDRDGPRQRSQPPDE